MKKVFVTGANGYIGNKFVEFLLKENYLVHAFVRNKDNSNLSFNKNLEIFEGNVNNIKSLINATRGVDYVVHMAAAKNDENDSYKINVIGSKNVVRASEVNQVKRLIYISTESVNIERKGVYAMTKLLGEKFFLESNIKSFVFRPSIVYSFDQGGIFETLVKYIKLFKIVPVFGDGKNYFHPIYINDLNKIILRAFKVNSSEKIYDIGGSDSITFNNLIYIIAKNLRKKVTILHFPIWLGIILAKVSTFLTHGNGISVSNVLGSSQIIKVDTKKTFEDLKIKPIGLKEGLRLVFENNLINIETEIIFNHILMLSGKKIGDVDFYSSKYQKALRINNIEGYKKGSWLFRSPKLLNGLDLLTVFKPESVLSQKLFIAAAIIESSQISAAWLLPRKRSFGEFVVVVFKLFSSLLFKALNMITILVQPNYEEYFK